MDCAKLKCSHFLYCDLGVPGARSVCDLFIGFRPDLAIVSPTKIVVGELTICHETNLIKSWDYKLQKYANLEAAVSSEFSRRTVLVNTIEISTLGFVIAEPDFFKNGEIPNFDLPIIKDLSKTAVLASKSIYDSR